MADERPVEELNREELIALAHELRNEIARNGKKIERQKEEIAKRDKEIQGLKRSLPRQESAGNRRGPAD